MTARRAPAGRGNPTALAARSKPYCFVSYSTREPHVSILIDCVKIVFAPKVDVRVTPSALQSGASQREQITSLIEGAAFAIVVLDGLRPNVVYELGLLHAQRKPVLLFKEAEAVVDIHGLFSTPPTELGADPPPVQLDTQLSDLKDINYATWNRFDLCGTLKLIWQEYSKKRSSMEEYVEIPEPKVCP